jgi:hypothetical protein
VSRKSIGECGFIASIRVLDSAAVYYTDHHKEEMPFSSSNRLAAVGNAWYARKRLPRRIPFGYFETKIV